MADNLVSIGLPIPQKSSLWIPLEAEVWLLVGLLDSLLVDEELKPTLLKLLLVRSKLELEELLLTAVVLLLLVKLAKLDDVLPLLEKLIRVLEVVLE
jgi:hypothetical protein